MTGIFKKKEPEEESYDESMEIVSKKIDGKLELKREIDAPTLVLNIANYIATNLATGVWDVWFNPEDRTRFCGYVDMFASTCILLKPDDTFKLELKKAKRKTGKLKRGFAAYEACIALIDRRGVGFPRKPGVDEYDLDDDDLYATQRIERENKDENESIREHNQSPQ